MSSGLPKYLHGLLCVALALAFLAPYCQAAGAGADHLCSCGMKAGSCACPRLAHGRGTGCGMGMGARCAVRSSQPVESGPRLTLDLHGRLGVLVLHRLEPALRPVAQLFVEPALPLDSLPRTPQLRPPRTLLAVS